MNFAGTLVAHLSPNSAIIESASGRKVGEGDLGELIARCGNALRQSGLSEGDRILIGCEMTPETVLIYLGAIYAGLVAVPVDRNLIYDRTLEFLQITEARAMWTQQSWSATDFDLSAVKLFFGDISSLAEAAPPIDRKASDLAALMTTSGSTGKPNFVMVTHENLTANTEAIIRSQRLGSGDESAMLIMSLGYVFGASILHTHLYVGGSVVLEHRFMFPDKVLRAINHYHCTTFAGVPTAYQLLLKMSSLGKIPLPSLRRFLQAGGAMPPVSIQQIKDLMPEVDFFVMYGQTEATARISCLDTRLFPAKLGSVGTVLDNLSVRILDENGRILSNGQRGEIAVSGPSISPGYWRNDKATAENFINKWLLTRDIGYLDHDNILWVTGRKGMFLKMRGYRVGIEEIEQYFSSVSGVIDCAVVGVTDPEAGEGFVLFIVVDQTTGLSLEQIKGSILKKMPKKWNCRDIQSIRELPRTPNGKVARADLKKMVKFPT